MPENLKELLKKNGITEKELATRAGISEQTIKRICNGKNKFIRVSTVKKICEALGESADFIYLGIGGEDPGEEDLEDIKHVIETHEPADKYKYMLLDRLRTDCEYFLGNGNRNVSQLWGGSVGTHIDSMLLLYDSFPEEDRPEWLTREQIKDYSERMGEALKSEPTEKETHNATATRKAFSSLTVGTLKSLEAEIYKAYGVDSKPAGLKWVEMALDLAKRITEEPGLLDAITEADLDQLTEENAHTARHAAEVALHLKKYTI